MTLLNWNKFEDIEPEPKTDVLVYSSTFSVSYYVPPRENYAYGWYPGGFATKGTLWSYLPEWRG